MNRVPNHEARTTIHGQVNIEVAGWSTLASPVLETKVNINGSLQQTPPILWDSRGTADGIIPLSAAASLGRGLPDVIDAIMVTVDNTAPVITITSPTETTYSTQGSLIPLEYSVQDNLDNNPRVSCVLLNGHPLTTDIVRERGSYQLVIKAVDAAGNYGERTVSFNIAAVNRPPNTPSTPSGPTTGTVGTSYTYSTSATDPDGDQVKYTFNWGDDTETTTGLFNSGTSASATHSWAAPGTYLVKAKATDSKGATSAAWSSTLSVNISAAVGQTLVDVPGLGGIRKGPSPNVLTIYSSGQYIEWTLWYGNTYQQGEVAINATGNVTIPHYASFILSISRPGAGKTAWLFGRENDGQLAYTTLTGTTVANTLVDVPGLGGIRKGPSPNVLTIYSSGQVVERTLWYGNTYQQGEVAINATGNVTIPHWASFILTIARPVVGKTAWLFARENDNQLAYAVIKSP